MGKGFHKKVPCEWELVPGEWDAASWFLGKHTGKSPCRSVSRSVVVVCGQDFRGLWVAVAGRTMQFSEASTAGLSLFSFLAVGGSSSLGIPVDINYVL